MRHVFSHFTAHYALSQICISRMRRRSGNARFVEPRDKSLRFGSANAKIHTFDIGEAVREISQNISQKRSTYVHVHTTCHTTCITTTELTDCVFARLQKEFKTQTKAQTDWKADPTRPRGTFLVVDRSIDPLAPLLHEFTYQATIHDLLEVDGETCKYVQHHTTPTTPTTSSPPPLQCAVCCVLTYHITHSVQSSTGICSVQTGRGRHCYCYCYCRYRSRNGCEIIIKRGRYYIG